MSSKALKKSDAPEVSAGVVILREDKKKGWVFLALEVYGRLDLPKGHVDDKDANGAQTSIEQIMNGARREALQESGYILSFDSDTDLNPNLRIARMTWGRDHTVCKSYDKSGNLKKDVYIFAAETACPHYMIGVNEKGFKEHDRGYWIPISEIENCALHKYLKPGVTWAVSRLAANDEEGNPL